MQKLRNFSLAKRIYCLSGSVILIFLLVIGSLFFQFRASLYETRRQEIKNLVETSWHILEFHAQQAASGKISPEEAQQRTLQIIRNQHFEQKNYFWISDMTPRMIMHPISPELEGKDLTNQRDPSGRPLFGDMVEIVNRDGAGFIEYLWPKPDESVPVKKVSYVKGFPSWNWMIGAGLYVDDIDRYLLHLLLVAGAILTLATVGAVLLVAWAARSISIPMGQAVAMIESLEGGNLNHRLHLDQTDEVGRLANSLDAFADNLQYEILTAFEHLACGNFSFKAKGLIREPLAQTNARLNTLVTKLDKAVVEAVEERTKTEALIAAIGDGVAIYDPELRLVFQNPTHISLVGRHVGDLCSLAYNHDEHNCAECDKKRSFTDGKIYNMERCVTIDDRDVHLDVTVSPVQNAVGDIVAIVEVARDVTSKKQFENVLIESEARYFSLFWNNHAVMLLIDPSSSAIIEANLSACSFYGYSQEQILGMKITDINTLSPEEISCEMEAARKELRRHFHFCHRLATGEVRDVEVYSEPALINGKELLYSIVHDITERRKIEAEREKLQFQLNHAQKMESVGSLAGGVAHDFNNKLTVILGCSYLADAEFDAVKLHTYIAEIRKAAEQSADLTRQLLAFARKQTIAPKVLDLNETVSGMLKMLQRLIGEDINLNWHPAPDLWEVELDPSQIDQILANLCVNARDSITNVGKITIETGISIIDEEYCTQNAGFVVGDYVRLAVSDDGCGMDKETLAHIFEPFFTTKGLGEGTGLGLATVYGIVRQNKGFINVYSEPGLGTTFTIYLPRYVGKTEKTRAKDIVESPKRGLETILLVEDEPAILNITMLILINQGYTVLAANSPSEAICLASEHKNEINLLMTDVVMPEMNGRDLAKKLQSFYPQLKCLYMSGYTANVIAHHGVLDAGLFFIQKPYNMNALADKLREVLDS